MLEEGYQQYLNELTVSDGKNATGRKVIDKVEVCGYWLIISNSDEMVTSSLRPRPTVPDCDTLSSVSYNRHCYQLVIHLQ